MPSRDHAPSQDDMLQPSLSVTHNEFRAIRALDPSSVTWVSTAKNYGRYENEGGQYDDLVTHLKTIKTW